MDIGCSLWICVGDLPTPVLTIDPKVPYAPTEEFFAQPTAPPTFAM
jgi:hypothetical protein